MNFPTLYNLCNIIGPGVQLLHQQLQLKSTYISVTVGNDWLKYIALDDLKAQFT
jgi:hypothetical protein